MSSNSLIPLPARQPLAVDAPLRGGETAAGAEAPPPVPVATIAAVIVDCVRDVLDEVASWASAGVHTRYVTPPPSGCAPTVECLPLAPLFGNEVPATGHLHRFVDVEDPSDPSAGSGATPVPLEVVASMIAVNVRRDLLDVQLAQSRHQVDNLHVALESNRKIGVAVGIVMATEHCTAAQAFDALRTASQTQNRKLRDIAAEVQYTGAMPVARMSRRA